MSVINKMLKDLEPKQDIEVSAKGNILLSNKNYNLIIIVGLMIIVIIFSGYFFIAIDNQQAASKQNQQSPAITPQAAEINAPLEDLQKEEKSASVVVVEKQVVTTQVPRVEPVITIPKQQQKTQTVLKKDSQAEMVATQNIQKINSNVVEKESLKSEKIFKITKSKIDPIQQAQRYWKDAEKYPQKAEMLLTKSLALDGSLHGARLQLIALFISQKRLSDAERVTDKGLILLPQDPAYIEWKARIRVASNDARTGLQWLLKITPDIKQHINYYGILAALASQLKYNDIAAETYLKLSKIQPKHGPWLLGMAISEERLGNNQNAKIYYQQAQTADGLTPRARIFIQQKLNKLES